MKQMISRTSWPMFLIGGLTMLGMALCYLALFFIYGAILPAPEGSEIGLRINNLIAYRDVIKAAYCIGYLLFGCLLCVSVQCVHGLFEQASVLVRNTTTLFGLFWVVALLCTGMVGITSLELIASIAKSDVDASISYYRTSLLIVESLGGGIEFIGGVWVLFIGVLAWQASKFPIAFILLSLTKGAIGIFTVFSSASILRDLFGLSGIVWFIWFGVLLLRHSKSH